MRASSLRRSSGRRGRCRSGRPTGGAPGCAGSRPGMRGTGTRWNPSASGSRNPRPSWPGRLEHETWTRRTQPPKGQRTRPSVDRQRTSQSFSDALPRPAEQSRPPDRAEPGHLADDPRTGPAPTRNRGRQDRGRPGQRPPPPRQSPDRPPRARPAAGAHHHDLPAAVRARPQPGRARPEHGQERHRHHPARDTRRNPRRIRLIRHRPHRRLRLRAPPTPRNQKRFCFMTAIATFSIFLTRKQRWSVPRSNIDGSPSSLDLHSTSFTVTLGSNSNRAFPLAGGPTT